MGLYLEAHSLAVEGGNRSYAGIALENMAAITQYRNDARLAWERYREAMLLFHSVGDYLGIVGCLVGLATAAISLSRIDEATTMLAAASGLAEAQLQDPCLVPGFEAVRTSLSEALSEAEFETACKPARYSMSKGSSPHLIVASSFSACKRLPPSGRLEIDVGDNPLHVAGDKIASGLIAIRIITRLACCPFAGGSGIDLDLDAIEC